MNKRKGTSKYALEAVKRVMSDGKERDFGEIVEAIYELPRPSFPTTIRHSQVPTRDELGWIGMKLGFTVTRQTRHYDGIVDGVRITVPKRVNVYQMK
jgi:hypothetical protein